MKKNTIIFLGLLALILAMNIGCSKDRDNNGNNDAQYVGYATTPLSCGNGANQQQYPTQLWSGYRQHGFYPYGNFAGYANGAGLGRRHYAYANNSYDNNWGYQQNQGFCGCPSGYMPACDGQYGMTCVVQNQYRNANYPVYNYDANSQGFEYRGYSQMAPVQNRRSNSCYRQVTVTCRIDDYQACVQTGGHCQPSQPNSPYGICVQ